MVTNLITINKQKKLSLKPSKSFKSSKCDIYTIHKQMGSNGEMSEKKENSTTAPQPNSDSRFQGTLVDHIPGWHVFLQKLHGPFLGWAHLLAARGPRGPWHLATTTAGPAGPGHLQRSAFDDEKRQQKGHGHNRSSNGSTIEKVNDMEFVKLSTELRGKKSTIPGESMCER